MNYGTLSSRGGEGGEGISGFLPKRGQRFSFKRLGAFPVVNG